MVPELALLSNFNLSLTYRIVCVTCSWNERTLQLPIRSAHSYQSCFSLLSIVPYLPCYICLLLPLQLSLQYLWSFLHWKVPWISSHKQSSSELAFQWWGTDNIKTQNRKDMWTAFGMLIESIFYKIANTWGSAVGFYSSKQCILTV